MKITNRRAYHDYQILEKVEAGIQLTGPEVKSVREGRASLVGSFVKIIGSEAYLVNALISLYQYTRPAGYDERRSRKLLMHKSELIALKTKVSGSSFSLVPLSMYTKAGFIKLEVGLGKGKRRYEKRESLKRKDLQREIEAQTGEKM